MGKPPNRGRFRIFPLGDVSLCRVSRNVSNAYRDDRYSSISWAIFQEKVDFNQLYGLSVSDFISYLQGGSDDTLLKLYGPIRP